MEKIKLVGGFYNNYFNELIIRLGAICLGRPAYREGWFWNFGLSRTGGGERLVSENSDVQKFGEK